MTPQSVKYSYLRGIIHLPDHKLHANGAYEAWGHGRRFGVVPLKYPELFWFAAVPTQDLPPVSVTQPSGIGQQRGASVGDEATKHWLLSLYAAWNGPRLELCPAALIAATPSQQILHTAIHKIPSVDSFPWSSSDSRLVLLGDR